MHCVCNYRHKLYFNEHLQDFQNHAQKFQKHLKKGEREIVISPLQTNSGGGGNQLVMQTMFRVGWHPSAHSVPGETRHSNLQVHPRLHRGHTVARGRGSEQQGSDRNPVHQQNLFKLLTLLPASGKRLVLVGEQEQASDGWAPGSTALC